MPVIIQYLLKLSLSIAVIHAFYYLVLRRLTFYNLNRWYLSGYTLLCFVIPFINVSQIADRADKNLPVLTYIPCVQNIKDYIPSTLNHPVQHSWNIWDLIIGLLAVGSAIMLGKLMLQIASFIRLKQKAEVLSDNGAVIYHVDEQIMPFSFGDSIYLNKNSHTAKELEEIIMHEYVHVKQRHSADILLAELFCIVNWYNPFAWFMRHSIRQNLEFIADDNVVRSGINKRDYQYHLLKVVGVPQYRIANQFNFSSLKKRIIMMNQQKSAKIHLLKFMFILPLLAVTLVAFRSEIANAVIKIKITPANNIKVDQALGHGKINETQSPKSGDKSVDVHAYFTGEVLKVTKNKAAYVLVIKHGGRFDAYTNLNSITVKEGDKITKGQLIGSVPIDKTTGLPTIKFSMFNSPQNIDANGNFINDTTKDDQGAITKSYSSIGADKITATTISKGSGNSSSDSYTVTGYGTVSTGNASLSSDKAWDKQTNNGNGLTTVGVLPNNSLGGPKGMAAGVVIYNADDLVYTIDPQHIDESQFGPIEKQFADKGFDLKIAADVKNGRANKINITISASRKDKSSSSVYAADDITEKDKILIKITASPETGSVSINSTAEDSDSK